MKKSACRLADAFFCFFLGVVVKMMLRYRGLLFSVCRRYSGDGLEVDCHWLTNCQRMAVADSFGWFGTVVDNENA
jgi:hypothetical protein